MDNPLYNQTSFRKASGRTLRPGGLAITQKGLEICAWPEKALVADIGCGIGASMELMKSMGLNPIGLDICQASLREARMNSGCPTILGRAEELPWPNAYLDGLICECVLSLTDDQCLVLREFYRVLKAGGKLLLADISLSSINNNSPLMNQIFLRGATHPEITLDRLSDAGFAVKQVNEYPEALEKLAVQLVWNGSADLKTWLGSFRPPGNCRRKYSYIQWIAEKME